MEDGVAHAADAESIRAQIAALQVLQLTML